MVKRVGWADSTTGSRGAKYSRFVDARKGLAGGVEFVDKHPDKKTGAKTIYRMRGRILVPIGSERVHQNFHGNDDTQTAMYQNQYRRAALANRRQNARRR